ncbi:MAG: hypothetical protein ABJF23_24495 [Bryobacteraceae bacterium]
MTTTLKVELVEYKGWRNCYRVSNGEVELIATSDVGPRIIRYGFVGGENVFKEFEAELGKSGEDRWMPRGGHRIWVAPEHRERTYVADNFPVEVKPAGDGVELIAPVEPETGLQKRIFIELAATGSAVKVTHSIINTLPQTVEIAAWALTLMAPGGTGITGFPPRGTHPEILLPTNPLVMWAFTDFSDKRWQFAKKYLLLHNDPKVSAPTKTGLFNAATWGAYLRNGTLFIKRYTADPEQRYPDFHCSYETFTNAEVLELETLGPLRSIQQGDGVEHVEHWTLNNRIDIPDFTDENLDEVLLPLL